MNGQDATGWAWASGLLDGVSDGVVVVRGGVVVGANEAFRDAVGLDEDALAGRGFRALFEDRRRGRGGEDGAFAGDGTEAEAEAGDGPRVAAAVAALRPGARADLGPVRWARAGGGVVLATAAARSRGDAEDVVAFVTRNGGAGEDAEPTRLEALARLAILTRVAAAAGHEINNPLTFLVGAVERARRELERLAAESPSPAAERLAECVGMIEQGVERVRVVAGELRVLGHSAGVAAADGDDDERPVDVARVLDESLRMAAHELRHRARVATSYAPGLVVTANPARLGQVFLNLLLNAGQAIGDRASAGGGDDDVRDGDDEVAVRAYARDDGRVVVEIADTGEGLPPGSEARIFDPFFTTKDEGRGTGLGLAVCRSIVRALGGAIEAEANEPRGARFRVTLPAAARDARGPAPGRDAPGPRADAPRPPPGDDPARRPRILVVDDEPNLARLLVWTLEEAHDVAVAGGGREAVEAMEAAEFDLVFCDLAMRDLTGMDVFERVRRARPGAEARIVFMTGGAFTPRARAFLEATTNPVLHKPFTPSRVEALVRRLVHGEDAVTVENPTAAVRASGPLR